MLLAIDTATRLMSIALHDGHNLLAEQTWMTGNRHTMELAPAINTMLALCEVEMSAVSALAVSIGPGSYTGLRIGVAFAKGLAAVKNIPLVGVTTLDTLAAGQPQYQGGLVTVVPAGRGRIIVQSYHWRKGRWNSRSEPRLMEWDALLQTLDGPAYITGELNQDGFEAVKAAQEKTMPVTIVSPAYRLRRAGFLAEYAWEKLNTSTDKSAFAAAKLLPVYLKTDDT